MNLMDLPISFRHYFDQSPDVLGGKLRLRGTRVSLEQILELLEAGAPPAEIAQSFPSTTLDAVTAVERLAAHFMLSMV